MESLNSLNHLMGFSGFFSLYAGLLLMLARKFLFRAMPDFFEGETVQIRRTFVCFACILGAMFLSFYSVGPFITVIAAQA